MFFQGSIAEAIGHAQGKLLLVFVTDGSTVSVDAEAALRSLADSDVVRGAVSLKLNDDLHADDRDTAPKFRDAKAFRTYCPITALPTVVAIGASGQALARVEGRDAADAPLLTEQLAAAHAAHLSLVEAAATAAATRPPPAANLQLRFADGSSLRHVFDPGATLGHVLAFVDAQRAEAPSGALPYVLVQPAAGSRRTLGAEQAGKTLQDLGLCGLVLLHVVPNAAGHRPPPRPAPTPREDPAGECRVPTVVPQSAEGSKGGEMPAAEEEQAEEQAASEEAEEEEEKERPAALEPDAPATLRLRFVDGTSLRTELEPDATLASLFAHIDAARLTARGGDQPYVLALPHAPADERLGPEQRELTMRELGICGPMALRVLPSAAGHRPPPRSPPQPRKVPTPPSGTQAPVRTRPPAPGPPRRQPRPKPQPKPKPPPPREIDVTVRMTSGGQLALPGVPLTSTLSSLLSTIDAQRTDGSRPYRLRCAYPPRTFAYADLGSTLGDLGFEPRTALALDACAPGEATDKPPDPSAPRAKLAIQIRLTNGTLLCAVLPPDATLADVLDYVDAHRSDGSGRYQLREAMPGGRAFFSGDLGATLAELRLPDAPQPALELEAVAPKPKRLSAPVPGAPGLALQFKLTNDDVLRGSFAPDSTLAEVRHWLDMNRTDGGAPYVLVSPCPKRKFGPEHTSSTLSALGLEPRSTLLLQAVGPAPGSSVSGPAKWLGAAASYFNPWSYFGSGEAEEEEKAGSDCEPTSPLPTEPTSARASGVGRASGVAHKRHHASGVHCLADQPDEGGDDSSNTFWNGNSTQYGGSSGGPHDG